MQKTFTRDLSRRLKWWYVVAAVGPIALKKGQEDY